jgi:hypothetical protein
VKSSEQNDILLYQAEDGKTCLEVHLDHETVWLTQAQLADLFDVKVPAISKHVRNIFNAGELDAEATVSKMERVRHEGRREVRRIEVAYSLDMIISIGYRVNSASSKTTLFPTATNALRRPSLSTFWRATAFSTGRTVPNASPITRWWR